MRLRLAAALAALLCGAAPAAADTTTVLRPPDRSPVVIAGTGVRQGDALTDGQLLVRRLTSVTAGKRRTITITCPTGTVHAGLGLFDLSRLGFRALNRYPGHRRARVEVFALSGTGTVRASIFALCEPATRAR